MPTVSPFVLDVPEPELDDLRDRLRRTRWPGPEPVGDWSQGVPLDVLRDLCAYWADGYDWRAFETRLNELGQVRVQAGGLGIHALHVRSPHEHATPLVLLHGWPGSVVEFLKAIDALVRPDDPADAFHVVAPSLPGYGFSDQPAETGWGVERIAAAVLDVMTRLGYERFGAHGGDWGTAIATVLGRDAPERVIALHLAPPLAGPAEEDLDRLTEAERAALDSLARARRDDSGYAKIQTTRPQTIGYALVDSPAALCAWVLDKIWSWTDAGGDPLTVLGRDEILDNLMLYWLPRTGASAARLYWESMRAFGRWFTRAADVRVGVPVGCTIPPKETIRPSRRWTERRFPDIRYWNEPHAGGHFAAWEQPETFVADVRATFRAAR